MTYTQLGKDGHINIRIGYDLNTWVLPLGIFYGTHRFLDDIESSWWCGFTFLCFFFEYNDERICPRLRDDDEM